MASSPPPSASPASATGNLVVLRTLSKAYGLAGARIGCAIADPAIIDLIARASPPYPLPTPSIAAALDALGPERMPIHRTRIARLLADRAAIAGQLTAVPEIQTVRQGGNFLFLEVADPAALAARLAAAAVRVRFRPNAAPGGVRVTIGTEVENGALLAVFGIGATTPSRRAEIVRDTKETRIAVAIDLDRPDPRRIDSGIPFYDHMLDQVAAHGGFSLVLGCSGDLDIDPHHSIEDIALAFGAALRQALGDKRGIGRFGFALPMDETSAEVLIDLSGRPFAKFDGSFATPAVGGLPTEMVPHIFRSLADSMGAAIHVRVAGDNDHHKVEACFKAFGRALRTGIGDRGHARRPALDQGHAVTALAHPRSRLWQHRFDPPRLRAARRGGGADRPTPTAADRLVIPGVGAAGYAMQALRDAGLVDPLRRRTKPTLGICLGMQLMFERTDEGDTAGPRPDPRPGPRDGSRPRLPRPPHGLVAA